MGFETNEPPILNKEHWTLEDYKQRMTHERWKQILLWSQEFVIFHGRLRKLIAKDLGFGVVEVYKEIIEENK